MEAQKWELKRILNALTVLSEAGCPFSIINEINEWIEKLEKNRDK